MAKKKVTKPVEEIVVKPEPIELTGPLSEVYKMFVSHLSSSEQEVYLSSPGKAIFAFKKFLNDMAPEEMVRLVTFGTEVSAEQ